MTETVLAVEELTKRYWADFWTRRVVAISGVSFEVRRGELFGFVGPNGAGKTTTIRTLMGLIHPDHGRCTVLGRRVPSRAARTRIGFLPEAPYFYDYLSPRELLDLVGRLHGLAPRARAQRTERLLDRVGLGDAATKPMRTLSKGMLQRVGLAQALVNDPELLILDEPMSGLDPIGRKDVRDLLLEERDAGKTIFFSTHILPDVEAICDRVALILRGRIEAVVPVRELLDRSLRGTEVVVLAPSGVSIDDLAPPGTALRRVEGELTITLGPDADVAAFLRAVGERATIVSVTPRRDSLEDLFVKKMRAAAEEGRA